MTTPAEVAEITVDDLFDPQPADLTEEEVNDATKDGVIPTPVTPVRFHLMLLVIQN